MPHEPDEMPDPELPGDHETSGDASPYPYRWPPVAPPRSPYTRQAHEPLLPPIGQVPESSTSGEARRSPRHARPRHAAPRQEAHPPEPESPPLEATANRGDPPPSPAPSAPAGTSRPERSSWAGGWTPSAAPPQPSRLGAITMLVVVTGLALFAATLVLTDFFDPSPTGQESAEPRDRAGSAPGTAAPSPDREQSSSPTPTPDSPRYRLTTPSEAGGLTKIDDPDLQQQFTTRMEDLGTPVRDPRFAAYTLPDQTDPHLYFIGGEWPAPLDLTETRYRALFSDLFRGAAAGVNGSYSGSSSSFGAGPLGGQLRCTTITGSQDLAACAWFDRYTFGFAGSYVTDSDDLAERLRAMRADMEVAPTGTGA